MKKLIGILILILILVWALSYALFPEHAADVAENQAAVAESFVTLNKGIVLFCFIVFVGALVMGLTRRIE